MTEAITPPPPGAPASAPTALAPRLADGIELIGEYEGSGFKEAPYLARRADGQTLQLTRLLYVVAESADGKRDYAEIAEVVAAELGRGVSARQRPLPRREEAAPARGARRRRRLEPELERPDPLLALKFRTAVVPERVTDAMTSVFRPLFWPPVVVAVLGFLAMDVWLFLVHGIAPGLRPRSTSRALLVLVFGAVVVAAAFHEIGHATACRYGGAQPGVMGVGLYLVWPAFYTDVTDAYRLGAAAGCAPTSAGSTSTRSSLSAPPGLLRSPARSRCCCWS